VTCPDLLALSQLLDEELPPADAGPIRTHAASCAACSARITRLTDAVTAMKAVVDGSAGASRAASALPDCLSASRLAAWLDGTAPEAERRTARAHLERCDLCLGEAVAAARVMTRLDATPPHRVPMALTARVASRWRAAAPAPSLATLVVAVTRAGARLVEKHLVAPFLDIAEVVAPAPAYRAEEPAPELCFQLLAADTRISATVFSAGDAVGLVLALEEASGERLADQRIFLRQRGRPIFSARTDAEGVLRTPGLERGVYEVSCPGISTSFRLDLR
jgi:anti-sigma factor RsiW